MLRRRFAQLQLTSLIVAIAILFGASAHAGDSFPVKVLGSDEASFLIKDESINEKAEDRAHYDAVVVGGGLAGLSAAIYLSDAKKNVLILEKEPHLGGLAYGGHLASKIRYDRGAAYWTDTYTEEQKILEHIGMGDFKDKDAIVEPSDSYLWNGRFYPGIWEEETLKVLPSSFALFKFELERANDDELIPNQPIEEAKDLSLDKMTAAEWVRQMPMTLEQYLASAKEPGTKLDKKAADRVKEGERIYRRFLRDKKVDRKDPMKDVLGLLELYCRSALGTTPNRVSGVAFANFYISEITTRYTTTIGTGGAAMAMGHMLRDRDNVEVKISSTVTKIDTGKNGVELSYVKDGKSHVVHTDYVVYAAQLRYAPEIINDLASLEPERAKLISGLGYAHYSVHTLLLNGHPFRATYDTWTRAADYKDDDFTDLILGRWMELKGYEKYRDFKRSPKDKTGIFTIYHPLPESWLGKGYTQEQAEKLARDAVARMQEIYSPLLKKKWGTTIDVRAVETTRWPFSVHVAEPGHFITKAKILRRPFGRIYFANNNLGTPAFEEALFRGHCAAVNILVKSAPGYKPEEWTQCPIEQPANP